MWPSTKLRPRALRSAASSSLHLTDLLHCPDCDDDGDPPHHTHHPPSLRDSGFWSSEPGSPSEPARDEFSPLLPPVFDSLVLDREPAGPVVTPPSSGLGLSPAVSHASPRQQEGEREREGEGRGKGKGKDAKQGPLDRLLDDYITSIRDEIAQLHKRLWEQKELNELLLERIQFQDGLIKRLLAARGPGKSSSPLPSSPSPPPPPPLDPPRKTIGIWGAVGEALDAYAEALGWCR